MNYILFLALLALLWGSVDAAISRSLKTTYETISGRECFRSFNGMMQSMKDLADKYPHLMTINIIGESYIKKYGTSGMNNITKYNVTYELPPGYDILAFNITASNSTRQSSDKGKMLIASRVHAREWATAELNGRFIETLVRGYGSIRTLLGFWRGMKFMRLSMSTPMAPFLHREVPPLYVA